jgi:hypothetical protein
MNNPLGVNSLAYSYGYDDSSMDLCIPVTNIVKASVDYIVSKVDNLKVRPLFTPLRGDFDVRSAVKEVQEYIDIDFYRLKVRQEVVKAAKKALVYDVGYVYVDVVANKVMALDPWQVGIVNTELDYGTLRSALIRIGEFPVSLLKPNYDINYDRVKGRIAVTLEIFYDLDDSVIRYFIDGAEVKTVKRYGSMIPIVPMFFNLPLSGKQSTSLVDDLIQLQVDVNEIDRDISEARNRALKSVYFVPNGSLSDVKQLDGAPGLVVEYRPIPGISQPVYHFDEEFISQQFIVERQAKIDFSYKTSGINDLMSEGKKPPGLNSGKALETMENIDSIRFSSLTSAIVRCNVDVATIFIDNHDPDEAILPEGKFSALKKWKDVQAQLDNFNVQFTATSSLSNDPEKRFELLEKMSQMGVIPQTKVALYMDMPDIESAYQEANAVADAVSFLISNVLKLPDSVLDESVEAALEQVDIPIFVDYASLEKEIVSVQNQFYSLGGDTRKNEIAKLQLLYVKVKQLMTEQTQTQTEGAGNLDQVGQDDAGFVSAGLQRAGSMGTGDPTAGQGAGGVPAAVPGGGGAGNSLAAAAGSGHRLQGVGTQQRLPEQGLMSGGSPNGT